MCGFGRVRFTGFGHVDEKKSSKKKKIQPIHFLSKTTDDHFKLYYNNMMSHVLAIFVFRFEIWRCRGKVAKVLSRRRHSFLFCYFLVFSLQNSAVTNDGRSLNNTKLTHIRGESMSCLAAAGGRFCFS